MCRSVVPADSTRAAFGRGLNGNLKDEHPHLEKITNIAVLRRVLDHNRLMGNGVRLHVGIGYATSDDEHEWGGPALRLAYETGLEAARLRRLAYLRSTRPTTKPETR